YVDGLLEATSAHARRIEGQPNRVILLLVIARSHPKFQPSLRQHVDSGGFFGQQRRVPKVVIVDIAADPEGGSRARRSDEQGTTGHRVSVVVSDQERIPAFCLESSGELSPRFRLILVRKDCSEAERTHHRLCLSLISTSEQRTGRRESQVMP